jgi:D-3-phosphoglycerate dehydrogenase / 2-oxoglutarate reductase
MLKILISDKFPEVGIELFSRNSDFKVDYKPDLTSAQLAEIIGDYDGLAIRSGTQVSEELLAAATKLKVVGRAGAGVDNVDVAAATGRGICVMNTPGGNTVTTGEHAVAMMLAMARKIPQADASLKSGQWRKSEFQGTEIFGKTLGILGLGRVGRVVAERALGFRMKVLAHDPFVSDEQARKIGIEKASFEQLLSRSDFITIHLPKTADTKNLIRAETISLMKKGARLINCARGGIVNEDDLLNALQSGHIAAAALDVFENEPSAESPLLQLDNVIATPHLGASTAEAQENVAVAVAQQMIDYLRDGVIVNAVNVASVSGESLKDVAPYMSLGEKLGAMQGQLSSEIPTEMLITYAGELAKLPNKPIGIAILKGFFSRLHEEVNFINAPVFADQHGMSVVESTRARDREYTNSLKVEVHYPDGKKRSLTGVKFGESDIRLTRYNANVINIEPEGHMLILRNKDVPGIVGFVGTLLGEAGINIANLRLARNRETNTALIFVTMDETPPDQTMKLLGESEGIVSVKCVKI